MESEKATGVPVIYLTKHVMCKSIVAMLLVLTVGMAHGMQLHAMQPQGNPQMLTDNKGEKKYSGNEFQAVALKNVLSLDLENVTLEQGLNTVARKAGLKLVYSTNIIPAHKRVSLQKSEMTLENVLWALLADTGLRFGVSSNNHLVIMKWAKKDKKTVQPVQAETVSGTVTDAQTGETLPGVNILVKGTSTGASTDADGQYELTVESLQDTLVVSFVGYQTQEVPINGRSQVNIALKTQAITGEEMVVVGYGSQKKSDLTGSVSSISQSQITQVPVTDVKQALKGQSAGVQVNTTSSRPGSPVNIQIRGNNSINGSNNPLYVIDGYIGGDINTVNVNDIESIQVLKDASATAIYGSRGANGVVVITTKTGQNNNNEVNFNARYGFRKIAHPLDLLNTEQFVQIANNIREAQEKKPLFDLNKVASGTDWQDEILHIAPTQQYNLSFSGGNDQLTYHLSGGYQNQNGIVINSAYKKYNVRLNLNDQLTSNLNVGARLGIVRTDQLQKRSDQPGEAGDNLKGPIAQAQTLAPTLTVYKNGSYNTPLKASDTDKLHSNPINYVKNNSGNKYNTAITGNIFAAYDILNNLVIKSTLGLNYDSSKFNYYKSSITYDRDFPSNRAIVQQGQRTTVLNENTLKYNNTFAGLHSLQVLAGFTIQQSKFEDQSSTAEQFATDAFKYNNLSAGTNIVGVESGSSRWALRSYISRINYTYNEKYLLTLTGRIDGSSKFGKNNKNGLFPSGAIGWKVSQEPFMQNIDVLSNLKIRASYGVTGSQATGPYQSLATEGSGHYVFGQERVVTFYPTRRANPGLQWERNAQVDVGIDAGFLNNRLVVNADYYHKKTTDMFVNIPVAATSGFSSELRNIGSLENEGVELGVSSTIISNKNFTWNIDINATWQKSKVLDLGSRRRILTGSSADGIKLGNTHIIRPGASFGSFYGYKTDGLFQTPDEVANSAQPDAKPGDVRYVDTNGDEIINSDDRVILGDSNPKYYGGFTTNFSYKGVGLSVFLQGQSGNSVLNISKYRLTGLNNPNDNKVKDVLNHWTGRGTSNSIPRLGYKRRGVVNDRYIEDASYLKLRNLTLSYNLQQKLISSLPIRHAKIYVSAKNLFTITDYSGYDPEVNLYGSSNRSINVDLGSYPSSRLYLLGIEIGL